MIEIFYYTSGIFCRNTNNMCFSNGSSYFNVNYLLIFVFFVDVPNSKFLRIFF